MRNWITGLFALALAAMPGVGRADDAPVTPAAGPAKVVVIPIHGPISSPQLFILRRGLKEAIDQGVKTVVLDMKTPGGELGVTFDMIEALQKFPGKTVTYVDNEAVSAGALIAAGTDEIYFSPDGVIGAAAPVNGSGEAIDATMRKKIVSYLKARVRLVSEGKGYRSEVISAMIDLDSEFKIGEEVIKAKDELLSLTAQEAMKEYGSPPQALLGTGIAGNLSELLDRVHGPGQWTSQRLEITWSENIARYLTSIAPVLMGLGLVLIAIELKTPGFGFFGIAGGVILALVFFGHSVAGLSGHEPMLFFALGLVLVIVELFFFPGSIVCGLAGVVLMLGSLVWSMADLWPSEPIVLSGDVFLQPLISVGIAIVLAMMIFLVLLHFLPKGNLWGNMVLQTAVRGEPGELKAIVAGEGRSGSLVGQTGIASTGLFPSGQIEIGGRRYEARVAVGFAEAGVPVIVTRQGEFSLEVEVIS